VEVAVVGRAVAEEGDRDAADALQRERRARRGGDAAADDPEAADQAVIEVDHVHRAGAAAADAGRAAEQLVEQALRIDADRERVPVPAVGPGHAVLGLQHRADPDGAGLLARVEVRRSVHLTSLEERLDRVLEAADQQHAAVQLERQLGRVVDAGPRRRRGGTGAHDRVSTGSPAATRSAPRTYWRPATSSSSAGKRVMISGPSARTTTSSSMRAAERPSDAAQ
jgi:hypothetical protein